MSWKLFGFGLACVVFAITVMLLTDSPATDAAMITCIVFGTACMGAGLAGGEGDGEFNSP